MKFISLALFAHLSIASQAATVANLSWNVGTQIPDKNPTGLSDTRPVISAITSITRVRVNLDITGGWTGDLYCYLTHDSGFAVLLNRPGRSLSVLDGSGANNLLITLADSGQSDIHTSIPNSGSVSGTFQPDARNVAPDHSTDTDPRTAFLSSFNGLDSNGNWTLFLADMATGDTMTLNSWALTIEGNVVPEPSVISLGFISAALVLRRRRKNSDDSFSSLGRMRISHTVVPKEG